LSEERKSDDPRTSKTEATSIIPVAANPTILVKKKNPGFEKSVRVSMHPLGPRTARQTEKALEGKVKKPRLSVEGGRV